MDVACFAVSCWQWHRTPATECCLVGTCTSCLCQPPVKYAHLECCCSVFCIQPGVGLAAEHGFFIRPPWKQRWHSRFPLADHSWQAMVMPILKQVRGVTGVCAVLSGGLEAATKAQQRAECCAAGPLSGLAAGVPAANTARQQQSIFLLTHGC